MSSTFNHQPARTWDTDPGPGPLPPRWPSCEEINAHRRLDGLAEIPSSLALTDALRDYGFMDCEGTPYRVSVSPAEAAEQAAA